MPEKKYQWLLLDADNTLFDFDAAEKAAFAELLGKLSLPDSPGLYECYHRCNARCWQLLERGETDAVSLRSLRFQMLLTEAATGWQTAPLELSRVYEACLGEQAILYPEVLPVLTALSPVYRLLLITNGLSGIQHRRVEVSSLAPLLSGVFVSEEMGCAKPDPAYFRRVLASAKIRDPAACLVVGDSLTADMDGAITAGLDCCWVNRNGRTDPAQRKITYIVPSLTGLETILGGNHS